MTGWCVLRIQGVSGVERSVFELFNGLPNGLHPLFRALYRVGFLVALGLVGAAALVGRRWRLVRDLLLAGVGSALIAVILNRLVGEPAEAPALFHLVSRWPAGPSFPSVRMALVVGLMAVIAAVARPRWPDNKRVCNSAIASTRPSASQYTERTEVRP